MNQTPPQPSPTQKTALAREKNIPTDWRFDHLLDGGEKACSELVMELREFFLPLPQASRVCVIAHDAGAWIDIPAWCRVTGHGYIAEAPPYYLLERR